MTDLDLTALRAVAEAATPGPWVQNGNGYIFGVAPGHCVAKIQEGFRYADAVFISEADPPTVIALIDRAERAEAAETALDRERQLFADADAGWKAAASERDALAAKLEAVERLADEWESQAKTAAERAAAVAFDRRQHYQDVSENYEVFASRLRAAVQSVQGDRPK